MWISTLNICPCHFKLICGWQISLDVVVSEIMSLVSMFSISTYNRKALAAWFLLCPCRLMVISDLWPLNQTIVSPTRRNVVNWHICHPTLHYKCSVIFQPDSACWVLDIIKLSLYKPYGVITHSSSLNETIWINFHT